MRGVRYNDKGKL